MSQPDQDKLNAFLGKMLGDLGAIIFMHVESATTWV